MKFELFLLAIIVLLSIRNVSITSGVRVEPRMARKCAHDMVFKAITIPNLIDFIPSTMPTTSPTTLRSGWVGILNCLNTSVVYENNNSNVNVTAYVIKLFRNTIWVNKKTWDNLQIEEQTRALIHECSHLAMDTNDYSYIHEDSFEKLRGMRAEKNADTQTIIIMNISRFKC